MNVFWKLVLLTTIATLALGRRPPPRHPMAYPGRGGRPIPIHQSEFAQRRIQHPHMGKFRGKPGPPGRRPPPPIGLRPPPPYGGKPNGQILFPPFPQEHRQQMQQKPKEQQKTTFEFAPSTLTSAQTTQQKSPIIQLHLPPGDQGGSSSIIQIHLSTTPAPPSAGVKDLFGASTLRSVAKVENRPSQSSPEQKQQELPKEKPSYEQKQPQEYRPEHRLPEQRPLEQEHRPVEQRPQFDPRPVDQRPEQRPHFDPRPVEQRPEQRPQFDHRPHFDPRPVDYKPEQRPHFDRPNYEHRPSEQTPQFEHRPENRPAYEPPFEHRPETVDYPEQRPEDRPYYREEQRPEHRPEQPYNRHQPEEPRPYERPETWTEVEWERPHDMHDAPYEPKHEPPYEPKHERPYEPKHERPYEPKHERPYEPKHERPYEPKHERPYEPKHEPPYEDKYEVYEDQRPDYSEHRASYEKKSKKKYSRESDEKYSQPDPLYHPDGDIIKSEERSDELPPRRTAIQEQVLKALGLQDGKLIEYLKKPLYGSSDTLLDFTSPTSAEVGYPGTSYKVKGRVPSVVLVPPGEYVKKQREPPVPRDPVKSEPKQTPPPRKQTEPTKQPNYQDHLAQGDTSQEYAHSVVVPPAQQQQQRYSGNHANYPTPHPHYYYVTEPEPIIEIIVQDSNVTYPPPPPRPPTPPPPPPTPEPVHVFYVRYSNNNKTSDLRLDPPVGSLDVRAPHAAYGPHAQGSIQHPVIHPVMHQQQQYQHPVQQQHPIQQQQPVHYQQQAQQQPVHYQQQSQQQPVHYQQQSQHFPHYTPEATTLRALIRPDKNEYESSRLTVGFNAQATGSQYTPSSGSQHTSQSTHYAQPSTQVNQYAPPSGSQHTSQSTHYAQPSTQLNQYAQPSSSQHTSQSTHYAQPSTQVNQYTPPSGSQPHQYAPNPPSGQDDQLPQSSIQHTSVFNSIRPNVVESSQVHVSSTVGPLVDYLEDRGPTQQPYGGKQPIYQPTQQPIYQSTQQPIYQSTQQHYSTQQPYQHHYSTQQPYQQPIQHYNPSTQQPYPTQQPYQQPTTQQPYHSTQQPYHYNQPTQQPYQPSYQSTQQPTYQQQTQQQQQLLNDQLQLQQQFNLATQNNEETNKEPSSEPDLNLDPIWTHWSTTEATDGDSSFQKRNGDSLPDGVPDELREQLVSSGILGNADVQVINFDSQMFKELNDLPPETLSALEAQIGGDSAPSGETLSSISRSVRSAIVVQEGGQRAKRRANPVTLLFTQDSTYLYKKEKLVRISKNKIVQRALELSSHRW